MSKDLKTKKEEIKNPVLDEMNEILDNEDHVVDDENFGKNSVLLSRDNFLKFKNEVKAKTNYVNLLIDQAQENNKRANNMAENNVSLMEAMKQSEENGKIHYKMIQEAGADINELRDKLEELCKNADFIEAGKVLQILNDYARFEVDETVFEEELLEGVEIIHGTEYE